jgi:hypothetical protein
MGEGREAPGSERSPTLPPRALPTGFPSAFKFPSRSREGCRSRTSGCHRQFARAQLCPVPLLHRVSPRPWPRAASQLCYPHALLRASPRACARAASQPFRPRPLPGFPSAFKFPSRSREGCRSRTSGCRRQFARARLRPVSPLHRVSPRPWPRAASQLCYPHTLLRASPRARARATAAAPAAATDNSRGLHPNRARFRSSHEPRTAPARLCLAPVFRKSPPGCGHDAPKTKPRPPRRGPGSKDP